MYIKLLQIKIKKEFIINPFDENIKTKKNLIKN